MTRAALAFLFVAAWFCGVTAAYGQSFEAASVKPATAGESLACGGGPGTAEAGLWHCSNMPLALVISKAFRFQDYQFSAHDSCCLERFDFIAWAPAGTTSEQFDRMLQNLLKERFQLAFHYQQKVMPIYELTVASNGLKMKKTAPGRFGRALSLDRIPLNHRGYCKDSFGSIESPGRGCYGAQENIRCGSEMGRRFEFYAQ